MFSRCLISVLVISLHINVAWSCVKTLDLPRRSDSTNKVYESQLGQMLAVAQHNKVGAVKSKYMGYGCYCGLGGQGEPVDATDRCCFVHDGCYDKIEVEEKISNLELLLTIFPYKATGAAHDDLKCIRNGAEETAYKKCLCDKVLAKCFLDNKDSYNPTYHQENYRENFC